MPKPSVEDIAALAKVSPVTVWRVMNNKPNISKATRERVLVAMRNLGTPLVDKTLVGLVIPNSDNPFFSDLAFQFEAAFEELDMHVLISSSDGKADREVKLIERFKAFGVKGLIYVPTGAGTETLLALIADGRMPCVGFDRRLKAAGNLDFVSVNSRHGTQSAVDYLFAQGHELIGYIKGLASTESAKERFESFRIAMDQNSLRIREDWIFEGDYSLAAGRSCAERLLQMPRDERPTAILAANDLMAISLMQRVQQGGWKLPDELSVIGFDNITWSGWVYPALTTIAQPIPLLVQEAVRLLAKRIAEFESSATRLPATVREIEPKLIPRDSVAPATPKSTPLALVRPFLESTTTAKD